MTTNQKKDAITALELTLAVNRGIIERLNQYAIMAQFTDSDAKVYEIECKISEIEEQNASIKREIKKLKEE